MRTTRYRRPRGAAHRAAATPPARTRRTRRVAPLALVQELASRALGLDLARVSGHQGASSYRAINRVSSWWR
jgi:hypothetical protein